MTQSRFLFHRLDADAGVPPLECIEGPDGCRGDVEMRWPGYGDRCWPRCQRHGNDRLDREEDNVRRHGLASTEPAGFDPYAIGESWRVA